MQILESGYRFRLDSFKGSLPQDIRFTQKLVTGEFVDGTTNEEVIDMMLARFYSLQVKNPSPENQCIIILLKSIKELLSKRLTKKIKKNETRQKNTEDTRRTESESSSKDHEWSFQLNFPRD